MYDVTTNHHPRPLLCAYELPAGVHAEFFDYDDDAEDNQSPRFFKYRDWWHDVQEIQRCGDNLKALGWDGFQPDSMGTGILVQWFDRDGEYRYDEIVAGYLVIS